MPSTIRFVPGVLLGAALSLFTLLMEMPQASAQSQTGCQGFFMVAANETGTAWTGNAEQTRIGTPDNSEEVQDQNATERVQGRGVRLEYPDRPIDMTGSAGVNNPLKIDNRAP